MNKVNFERFFNAQKTIDKEKRVKKEEQNHFLDFIKDYIQKNEIPVEVLNFEDKIFLSKFQLLIEEIDVNGPNIVSSGCDLINVLIRFTLNSSDLVVALKLKEEYEYIVECKELDLKCFRPTGSHFAANAEVKISYWLGEEHQKKILKLSNH